jgi:hypothetical protein
MQDPVSQRLVTVALTITVIVLVAVTLINLDRHGRLSAHAASCFISAGSPIASGACGAPGGRAVR